ncbi:MAG TPA: WD40 repeat domain-containing protein [Pirellulales bacterium]|jgi:WD40 repeat protein|nr:WD40 repeat domain-containing protein [Pirellulales bacterium]
MLFRTLRIFIFACGVTLVYLSALGQPLQCVGHTRFVTSVSLSPDGKLVVSGSDDGTARIWDALNGKELRRLAIYNTGDKLGGPVTVLFSPEGNLIAATARLKPVTFWNPITGEQQQEACPADGVNGLAFSSDGLDLAIAEQSQITVWNLQRRKQLQVFPVDKRDIARSLTVAISPDGTMLAGGLQGIAEWPYSKIPRVHVWQLPSGTELFTAWPYLGPARSLAFSPDNKLLAIGGENAGMFEIWDVKAQKMVQQIQADKKAVFCVAFNPDGKTIATGGTEPSIKLWDVSGQLHGLLEGHGDQVNYLSYSKDGKKLASAGRDKLVLIWRPESDAVKPNKKE